MSSYVSAAIVLALIVLEAVFVMAEISLVSLRESQVRGLAETGGRAGTKVAKLVANPNRFLAAVQLGVTLTSLLSSAFGAITLSDRLADRLRDAGLGKTLAGVVGFLVVTLVITYVTLVIGELAPKRIGLQRAERTALRLAGPLDALARLSRPVIWGLSKSTDGVVRLAGGDPSLSRESITDEELRGLVASHESLSQDERRLIDDVFAAAERTVREVMAPRTEVAFLDAGTTVAAAARQIREHPHSRYPVFRDSHDDVIGFVHVRDLFAAADRRTAKVGDLVRPVAQLPANKSLLPSLSELRAAGQHLAVVIDEYGGTAGIVTLEDLIEEVVGDIRDEYDTTAADLRLLRGGDVEVEGLLNLEDFAEVTGVPLPEGPYETAAGFLVARLGRVARLGDAVEVDRARLSVTRLDGRRVDRLRVSITPPDPPDDPSSGTSSTSSIHASGTATGASGTVSAGASGTASAGASGTLSSGASGTASAGASGGQAARSAAAARRPGPTETSSRGRPGRLPA